MFEPSTLMEAIRHFEDPKTSFEFMVKLRWPDRVQCPHCGSSEVYTIATRKIWRCKSTHRRREFSVRTGTVMEGSPIPLDKWFAAMWLVANAKNGVSSHEIGRSIGVTQKTAWFLLHRIRLAMQSDDESTKLEGPVEIDETYVGGQARFMHHDRKKRTITGRGGTGKIIVMGFLKRSERDQASVVKAKIISDTATDTLTEAVKRHIAPGSLVYTDQLASYRKLPERYTHEVINHAEIYVRGKVHTNGIENYWSVLKRTLKGTYISVAPLHLFRYLDEQAFRFNLRMGNDAFRFADLANKLEGRRLTYKELTRDSLIIAISRSPRRRAVSGLSILPPRPRRGLQASARMHPRTWAVSVAACR